MSGSLAKTYIGANEACKLYTNSSGKPASVTIHAAAIDPASDACLSMKYSSTNTNIYVETTADASVGVTLNDYRTTLVDSELSYIGYVYHQIACDGPEYVTPSLYLDSDGTSAVFKPCILNMVCVSSSYPFQNVPTRIGDYAICFNSTACALYCTYSSIHQNTQNYRNFHNSTLATKQQTNAVLMFCCDKVGTSPEFVSEGWGPIIAGCFCAFNNRQKLGTVQGKYKYYYTGFSCLCQVSNHTLLINDGSQGQVVVEDIWHDDNPTFAVNLLSGGDAGGGCLSTRVTAYADVCILGYTRTGCNSSSMCNVYSDAAHRSIKQVCFCCGCCCRLDINLYRAMHYKPILVGCGVVIFNNLETSCTCTCRGAFIMGYPADCYYQHCDYQCKCKFWCDMANAINGQPCLTPCQQCKFICRFNGSTLKWLTYNPVTNCNYFEIMGDGSRDGIYTLNSSCFFLTCKCCCDCVRVINKPFETWVTEGAMVKVSSTPSAWSEKDSFLEVVTQPMMIGESKWAIWRACHTFGTPLSGGWNGCYFRYESRDLINWEKTSDVGNTATLYCCGSGSSLCKINFTYDGTDVVKGINYYHNTANCVDNSGTLEYKTAANRLERTGVVISCNDTLYISNDGVTPAAVQIWGYDD